MVLPCKKNNALGKQQDHRSAYGNRQVGINIFYTDFGQNRS